MADANRIQSGNTDKIQSRTERVIIPARGFISSDELNRFFESCTDDLSMITTHLNGVASAVSETAHIQNLDSHDSHQRALAIEEDLAFLRKMLGLRGDKVSRWCDFHDASGVTFVTGSDASKRASIATDYGQVTLPMNSIESRTYSLRLLAGGTVTPSTTIVTTSGTFDKLDGNGATDYEFGGTVEETDPKNCVNGNNTSYWRRRVIFDLESDVSEVECELTIQVPPSANLYANVVYAHVYPMGDVDITGIWLSPDLSDSYSALSSFIEIQGAGKHRWFTASQKVAKLKIRLRQRNWHEENGKKVFEYGMQEFGLQSVDWDKTYDEDAVALTANHTIVKRVDADDGVVFNELYGFYCRPDFTLETAGNRHIHVKVATDEDGESVVWDSDVQALPQNLAAPISLGSSSSIYVFITLNWADTVSVNSPYEAGTPPFLTGFGLEFTYTEE